MDSSFLPDSIAEPAQHEIPIPSPATFSGCFTRSAIDTVKMSKTR